MRRDRVHWRVPQIPHRVSAIELSWQDKSTSSLRASLATLAILAFLATGCDQIGEQAGKAVEQRVQQEAGSLMDKAIGSVDKTLVGVGSQLTKGGIKPRLVADPSLQVEGITPTSLTIQESPGRVISIYCTFEKASDSMLEVRFLNKSGAEIGRAQRQVSAKAGAGQFTEFPIDPRADIREIVTVSVRKS